MTTYKLTRHSFAAVLLTVTVFASDVTAQTEQKARGTTYFPTTGKWQRKAPVDMGMDAAKLQDAVQWAQAHPSKWDFERDQVRVFGRVLGRLPGQRAATNGIILRHGYIVAEFGDTKANDPVYSVAKSFLSTAASLAFAKGLIRSVDDRVSDYIHDGGYDSPHNAKITWKNHLQQESEWEGELWGKNANFLGLEEFGSGRRDPREIHDPGTYYEYNDVRINRFALSLARVFGRGVPEVFKENIMDKIGASNEWKWSRLRGSVDRYDKQQACGVGERRHTLGRRAVDQFAGSRTLRPADSQQRGLGRQEAGLGAMD